MSTLVTVDPIETFFDELGKRGHVPLLDHVSGILEFDIEGTARRWVTVNRGVLVVSRIPVNADCVLSSDVALGLSIQRVGEPE
jgi:hypothetical protein